MADESPSASGARPVPVAGVGQRSMVGFLWMFLQTTGARLASALGQVVLARLLTPEDFGQVGLANTVLAFATVLSNPGLEDILVHRGARLSRWINAAFWMSAIAGILGAAVMWLASPLAAYVYQAPSLPPLIFVLSASALVSALTTVPQAQLRARMEFRLLATTGVFTAILHVGLAILFAWQGMGAMSYILPLPISGALRALLLWRATKPTLFANLSLRRWKRLLPDTFSLFLSRLLGSVVSQGDYMILGALASAEQVGLYYFAFNLSRQVVQVFTVNLSSVLLPALSALQAEPVRQMKAALRASSLLAVLTIPLCLGQAAIAEPLVKLFFGDQWLASIPMLQLLMLGTAINAPSWMNVNLLQAQGRHATVARVQLFAASTFLFWVTLGAYWKQGLGVALASSWAISISSIVGIFVAIRPAGGGIKEILAIYQGPTLLSIGAIGGSWAVLHAVPGLQAHPLVELLAMIALSVPLYLLGVKVGLPSIWQELLQQLKNLRARRAARP